jgi:hypothetical protein
VAGAYTNTRNNALDTQGDGTAIVHFWQLDNTPPLIGHSGDLLWYKVVASKFFIYATTLESLDKCTLVSFKQSLLRGKPKEVSTVPVKCHQTIASETGAIISIAQSCIPTL